MSHGVHAVQHEVEHKIKHDEHGHGLDGVSSTHKMVITGPAVPGFIASGIALSAGAAFMGFGLLAPHLLHLG